ncbi:MAG: glucose-1-phosphate adenylyltransferase subunit GlgD [Oscillospiraceae bacterium]|nr:glucose-1-phosphate adenylyltransferase subunit GlgD [Oscillospiraceae bacterium]
MITSMGLIMTNYSDGSFGSLTEDRPVATLPFGGRYRLIDFPLSNMVNSRINTVGIITPYMYRSLMDHVGAGKEWMLNRKVGGMFFLPGSIYGVKNQSHSKFLLRDIILNRSYLERADHDVVVVCGSNKIFNIDYRKVCGHHEASGADITLVYKPGYTTCEGPERYLEISSTERVTGFLSEADDKANCFMDAFVINRSLLLKFMNWYGALDYMDLTEIFEDNLDKVRINAYSFDGYLGSVNGLASYMSSNLELLDPEVRNELFLGYHRIKTKVSDAAPAKYITGAKVENSLISTGCTVGGTVENSILFRGAKVAPGATVKNCIVMQKCTIEQGAVLENVILDKYATIKAGVRLSGTKELPISVGKRQSI